MNAEIALQIRQQLLTQSDVAVLRCYEAGVPVPEVIQQYRQALRDITKNPKFPNMSWPRRPTELQCKWINI